MKKPVFFVCVAFLMVMVIGCSTVVTQTPPVPTQPQLPEIEDAAIPATEQTKSDNVNEIVETITPYVENPQNNSLSNSPSATSDDIRVVPFNPDEYLSDDEFVFAGGVRLGMSYEEVLEILGSYDEAFDNAPGVKSIIKDGVHYGFFQINETFTNQSDLKIDGVYRLLNLSVAEFSDEIFPRGIKVGDSIEDVLNKFPGKDKELSQL